MYGDVMSFIVYVTRSVPQGSVLGTLFFILYMADVQNGGIYQSFGGSFIHPFSDNGQIGRERVNPWRNIPRNISP